MMNKNILCFYLASLLYLLSTMAQAEIWAYQVHGKSVGDCKIRPEANIDEVWMALEKYTGQRFDISRETSLVPGYVLQRVDKKGEFTFYPNRHSCEFERQAIAVMLGGNRKKLLELKEALTEEAKLAAMSPADIHDEQRQTWVSFFIGCSNTNLRKKMPLQGHLQNLISLCDCTARRAIELQKEGVAWEKIKEMAPKFSTACNVERF